MCFWLASGFGGHAQVPSSLGRLGCADAQQVVSNLVWPRENWRAVRMSESHSLFLQVSSREEQQREKNGQEVAASPRSGE